MDLTTVLQLVLLPAGAVAVAGFARWRGWSVPLLLVSAGLVVGLIAAQVPGAPEYELDPELVLFGFLPPLLYSAALDSSYLRLREVRRPVVLLSVGLVLFSAAVIGLLTHLLVPGLPLAAAFALGAIVAPPDAVAAVAVARKLGLPRKVITILVGESLFNDATALTAFRVAAGAAGGAGLVAGGVGFTLVTAAGQLLYAAGVGLAIGLVLALAFGRLMNFVRDPLITNAISLLIPFGSYLAAEAVHASGVLSVVVVGVYLGHRMNRTTYGTRVVSYSVWKVVDFLLENVVFLLIGLQLPLILRGLAGQDPVRVAGYAVAVFAAVIVARVIWVFAGTYLPRVLSRKIREREPRPPVSNIMVIGWAGMRGVVSLAAAFTLPADFPGRDLILFLTFIVVIGTLLVQGLSFPWLIRRLGVSSEGEAFRDNLSEAAAQQAAAGAALARLDELTREGVQETHADVVHRLRTHAERRAMGAWERLGGGTGPEGEETPSALYRRLRRAMLEAERSVLVRLRDERRIDDEVLRRVTRELDYEEATLARE
ncbi:Na+/H+ antiporter [Sphaerisporangium siamense]|uniref:CPA1 family monovalent cation:H+ antiporter n=1 Tax=Sphaerisporangium siamense TaxID=795645 RepID=A0A7W7DBK0_9ACTN|nr:Na+/H+ antiporter [Sphaerisporangium siamense]MBB4702965.1 CPA1 family monovalent cation:H+ antiporter [Sphaerisporangium siamense]GII83276.1 Na+/H+ antiporter [Sphaerisporangium siamense]